MAQIVTDDRRDSVVIREQNPEVVEREPVAHSSMSIGGVVLAVLVVLLLLLLLRGMF